jgi:hypothetical protein
MEWWQKQGYLAGKELSEGLWMCIARMMTTHRLMICTRAFVHEFWCYPYDTVPFSYVLEAFNKFDGTGDPAEGWVKHYPSERRREPVIVG